MNLSDNFKKFMGMVEQNVEGLKKDLTPTPLPSGSDVWKAGEENSKKMKEEVLKSKGAEMATDLLPGGSLVGITKKYAGASRESLTRLKTSTINDLSFYTQQSVENAMTHGAEHSITKWSTEFITKTKSKIAEIEDALKSFDELNMGGGVMFDNTLPTEGVVRKGNIDIDKRVKVSNTDGSFSTVESMSFNEGGVEVLIPTLSPEGKKLSGEEAIKLYKDTGQHLGMFASGELADRYAKALSKRQGKVYNKEQ